jgi:hypothetical protein
MVTASYVVAGTTCTGLLARLSVPVEDASYEVTPHTVATVGVYRCVVTVTTYAITPQAVSPVATKVLTVNRLEFAVALGSAALVVLYPPLGIAPAAITVGFAGQVGLVRHLRLLTTHYLVRVSTNPVWLYYTLPAPVVPTIGAGSVVVANKLGYALADTLSTTIGYTVLYDKTGYVLWDDSATSNGYAVAHDEPGYVLGGASGSRILHDAPGCTVELDAGYVALYSDMGYAFWVEEDYERL